MSIVTLKKKTGSQYNNMSVGSKHGFSLNGTHRSQGYVGQTSLSRSLPTTSMRGNAAKGYGGCCGKYEIRPIIQSAVVSLNDPTVIKSSSLNTSGMISTHYRWIKRPQPFASVKPSAMNNLNSQGFLINKLRNNAIKANSSGPCKTIFPTDEPDYKTICLETKSSNYNKLHNCPPITKDLSNKFAMAQSTYMQYLASGCSNNENDNINPPSVNNGTPYSCGI
jgi:hypothetical protein